MIPQETLIQAINRYFPDVWPCSLEDWKEFGHDNKVIKQKKEAVINRGFLEWVEKLTSQERMVDVLQRLRAGLEEIRGREEFNELTAHVLIVCFSTTPFVADLNRDQWKLQDEYREHLENLKIQLGGLEKFLEGCKADRNNRYKPEEIMGTSDFFDCLKREGLKLTSSNPDKLRLSIDALKNLIGGFIRQLKFELYGPVSDFDQTYQNFLQEIEDDGIVGSRFSNSNADFFRQLEVQNAAGPDFVGTKICSLIHTDEIAKQARGNKAIVNSLLFHLSFLFRQYTSSDSDGPWLKNIKGEMPSDGRPCYEQVTDISNVVLSFIGVFQGEEQELSDQQVRQRVNNLTNKRVELGSLLTVDF
jgi:hypothetical protein